MNSQDSQYAHMGMLLNKGCDWMRSMVGECAQRCPRSGWFLELEEGGKVALMALMGDFGHQLVGLSQFLKTHLKSLPS